MSLILIDNGVALLGSIFGSDGVSHDVHYGTRGEILVWAHMISDVVIWLACMWIPIAILYYVQKRPSISQKKLLYLFAAFIALCGFTHLMEVATLWRPAYRFLGVFTILTAVVSVITVVVLVKQLPKLVNAPVPSELELEIAKRKETEKQLTASVRMFSSAMTNAPIGKALVSTEGNWIRVNKKLCELLGYDEEALLRRNFQELTYHADLETDLALVEKTLRGEIDSYSIEKRYIRQNGELLYARLNVVLIRDENGEPDFFISQIEDLTNETKLYQKQAGLIRELEQKTHDMQQIVYVSSHDLRSPLVNIIGFSSELEKTTSDLMELLKSQEGLPPRVSQILCDDIPEMVHFISDSGRRMDRLLKGLLQYSRLGRYPVEERQINMDDLISDLLRDMSFLLKEDGAKVHVSALPKCYGDPNLLGQLFRNVLSNAINYRDRNRKLQIDIVAQSMSTHNRYTVIDNGVGIDEQYHEKIFEVFHRLNPEDTEGDGMGLSICSLLVQRMQGRIWLESEPGVGSKFHIELPRTDASKSMHVAGSEQVAHSYLSES